jgi:hypothetical protein
MKSIRELLEDADPLRREPWRPSGQHDRQRQAVIEAASNACAPARSRWRPRLAVIAIAALLLMAASFFGPRGRSLFIPDLRAAAIRFEVRLAEERPAPGLREAKVSGSDRTVYLHDEVIVSNSDIAEAQVVPGNASTEYWVGIKFKPAGADKMRAATTKHIGRPLAILLDGQVVMVPVLRTPIDSSARITGNFTRAQAERIVNGIEVQ